MATSGSATLLKIIALVEGISRVDINLASLFNTVAEINAKILQTSVSLTGYTQGFEEAFNKAQKLSKDFNYNIEVTNELVRVFGTRFRVPITEIGEMTDVLKKAEEMFGKSSNLAKFFVEDLAKIESQAGPLRDTFLDLIKLDADIKELRGKEDKSEKEEENLKAMVRQHERIAEVTRTSLDLKFANGEIERDQYNRLFLTTVLNEKSFEQSKTAAHETADAINKMQGAAVQINNLFIDILNKSPEAIKGMIGITMTGGSQVVSDVSKFLSNMFDEFKTEGLGPLDPKKVEEHLETIKKITGLAAPAMLEDIEKSMMGGGAEYAQKYAEYLEKVKQYEDAIAAGKPLRGPDGEKLEMPTAPEAPKIDAAESVRKILEENGLTGELLEGAVSGFLEQNEDKLRVSEAAVRASVEEYKKLIEAAQNATGAEKTALDNAIVQFREKSQAIQDAKNAQEEYNKLMNNMKAGIPGIESQAILRARSGLTSTDKSEYTDVNADRIASDLARKQIETSIASNMKLLQSAKESAEQIMQDISKASTDEERAKLQTQLEASTKNIQDAQRLIGLDSQRLLDIQAVSLAQVNAIGKNIETRAGYIRAELEHNKALISLQDSLAVGISASVGLREKAASLALQEAKVKKEEIERYDKEIAIASDPGVAAELEKKRNEAMTKYVSLQKEALDMTQKLREGYLEAIDAMNTGQGMFLEIVLDQEKGLGALIRTTEEVPRVLKTGAGSGGILSPTSFGPGGISGGFDPNSPEYSEHVLNNMDKINEAVGDLQEVISQSAEKTGDRIAWAIKSRPEFIGQVDAGAYPGSGGAASVGRPGAPRSTGEDSEGSAVGPSASQGATGGGSAKDSTREMNRPNVPPPGYPLGIQEIPCINICDFDTMSLSATVEKIPEKMLESSSQPGNGVNVSSYGVSSSSLNVEAMITQVAEVIHEGVVKGVSIGVERALKELASK